MNIFTTILIQPLANGLILFYKLLGQNMGLAIIGFSLFLRFALRPLTKPYMESMQKMKKYAPQLEKLKKKHKDDKVKQAQAQAEFYRQKGINPSAGCIPYLLQIVILIAFFRVFTLTLSGEVNPTQAFNDLLYGPLKFVNGQALNLNFLYLDIAEPDVINIPGLPFGLPGPILILAALVQFVSAQVMAPYTKETEETAEKTPGLADDLQASMQRSMTFMFPLFTLIIGLRFPSGLALYWLVFSITQAYQSISTQGWGGLTPWLEKFNLLKSQNKDK